MRGHWRQLTPALLGALALACTQPDEGPDMAGTTDPAGSHGAEGPGDPDPPVLEIAAPARGALLGSAGSVEVRGKVTDPGSGVESLQINGTAVTVAADGSFRTTVKLSPGITLIQSRAVDRETNVESETRAVLSGDLVPVDRVVTDGMTLRVDRQLLRTAGEVGARQLSAMNLDAVVKGENPVFDAGWSCLKARVDVSRVKKGAISFVLDPMSGGVNVDASVADLEIAFHVAYNVGCTDHVGDIVFSATKFRLSGKVGVTLTGDGNIGLDVSQADASFEGFRWGGDVLPETMRTYLQEPLSDALSAMIATELETQLGEQVSERLRARETAVDVAGTQVMVALKPTSLRIDDSGLVMSLDSRVSVAAPAGTVFPRSTAARPALEKTTGGLRVGISDDALNELLASLWGAGVLERAIVLPQDQLSALGFGFNHAEVELAMAPVVEALPDGKGLRVTVADVLCSFEQRDAGKPARPAGKIAVSLRGTFTARIVDDHLALTTASPELTIDLLVPDDAGKLNEGALRQLVSLFQNRIVTALGEAVGSVPLPAIDGMKVVNGAVTSGDASGGYLVVHGDVAAR